MAFLTQNRMDLRLIKAFCAVYEEGSINKAASRLHVAQPNVSVAIKNLELDLRTILFDRSAAGTTPTSVAHAFYARLRKAMFDLHAAHEAVHAAANDAKGPLRVGVLPSVAKSVLPGFVPSLLENYRDVELRLVGMPQELCQLALEGELDFVVVSGAADDPRLVSYPLKTERLMLVSSIDNPAIPRGPVDMRNVPPLKLALPLGQGTFHSKIDEHIAAGTISVSQTVRINGLSARIDLVKRTDWMTIMPISALMDDFHTIVAREIVFPSLRVDYFVVRSAFYTPDVTAESFYRHIGKSVQDATQVCDAFLANEKVAVRRGDSECRARG
jgi:LysR family transcriptional regulator, nitrogen assimilation regulatory protein